MRVSLSVHENWHFVELLLKIGNEQMPQYNEKISLDNENLCILVNDLQEWVANVYLEIAKTIPWFSERGILTHTNDQVGQVNDLILSKINAPTRTYYSIDLEESFYFPRKFLKSWWLYGVPPNELVLTLWYPIVQWYTFASEIF